MKTILSFLFFVLASSSLMGHEGHDVPGSLPLPPHGGKITEAEHAEAQKGHKHGEGDELFFEAVYSNRQIKVYPLLLKSSDATRFAKMNPAKELKDVSLSVEFPRKKKSEPLQAEMKADGLVASFNPKGSHRFILNIKSTFANEKLIAKIQLESR